MAIFILKNEIERGTKRVAVKPTYKWTSEWFTDA